MFTTTGLAASVWLPLKRRANSSLSISARMMNSMKLTNSGIAVHENAR